MKNKNILIGIGVAVLGIIGYYYYASLEDYDEYFDEDEDEDENYDCVDFEAITCNIDGSINFILQGADLDSETIQISEACCVGKGYEWGPNGAGTKNQCNCPSGGL